MLERWKRAGHKPKVSHQIDGAANPVMRFIPNVTMPSPRRPKHVGGRRSTIDLSQLVACHCHMSRLLISLRLRRDVLSRGGCSHIELRTIEECPASALQLVEAPVPMRWGQAGNRSLNPDVHSHWTLKSKVHKWAF
ncbi:hypothetical protein PCASD_15667 [Puccinia coronata f. sp. avenae]|uniref:Uncharacterized protein n=1 Tax=Puccinia coronata f. sp. avenae TaxID=200324 RepID=A0A2N5SM45_9BASI|nr:hypothetical protein PCASD_15667 [Puccinia coronata f. sp. avenae]